MKIFFAGSESFSKIISETKARALINYFYIKDKTNILTFKKDNNIKELFIDSGAFTAWTKGVKIDINEYCEFVKKADCDFYSVLDVIGDAEGTLQNQIEMERQGCKPVPCFHYGGDKKYLEYYINKGYELISLGGMVGKQSSILRGWLDNIFQKYPNQKFHGFGLTRKKLIERYPWYSVDSSSWIKFTASKRIFSYFEGEFYLGTDKNMSLLNLKNNQKLINYLKKYNIYDENFYENYNNILKANIYGFIEFELNDKIPKLNKQKTLF